MANGKPTLAVLNNKIDNNKDDINNIGRKIDMIEKHCNGQDINTVKINEAIINIKSDIKNLFAGQKWITGLLIVSILIPIALFAISKFVK